MTVPPTSGANPQEVPATRSPDGLERLTVHVLWEHGPTVGEASPSAQEIGAIALSLETAYEALATATGYPPHFLVVTGVKNSILEFSLEGVGEAITALRGLIEAAPTLLLNLFRPRKFVNRLMLEQEVKELRLKKEKKELEVDIDKTELEHLKTKAELAEYRRMAALNPLEPDAVAHEMLGRIVASVAQKPQSPRLIRATVQYAMATEGYQPTARAALRVSPQSGLQASPPPHFQTQGAPTVESKRGQNG
jgi:hypothetical protein